MRRGLILGAVACLGAWALPAWGQGGNPPASTKESKATSGKGMTAVEQTYPPEAPRPDAVKVAPDNFKVLLDNDRVRVLDVHTKPGDKIGMHSHPDYIVYFFTADKEKFTYPDGKSVEREGQAGQAGWHKAETHVSENVGTGEAHALLIELKGPAKK
jgi:quercetin dioxygenase-like cupin family protein